jgi:fructokinase
MDVLCLGELLVDMFPSEVGVKLIEVSSFRPKPGGAPANVAVAIARLGAKSGFLGKVGEDLFGRFLKSVLDKEWVDTRGLKFDAETRTTLVFIALPDANAAEFVFYRNPGADTRLRPEELNLDLLQSASCLHFGSLSLTDEPSRSAAKYAAETARASKTIVSFDANYRPTLWDSAEQAKQKIMEVIPLIDLIKVNETELALLTGETDLSKGTSILQSQGPPICIVTLGAKGSFFRTVEATGFEPAFQVNAIDATGCGDAFIAGLLTRLTSGCEWQYQLSQERMQKNLQWANAVGALTSLKIGVIPALPTAVQVRDFLEKQNLGSFYD